MANQSCPQCGRPLAPNAPAGLCPACLFGAATARGGATPSAPPDAALPGLEELGALFPEFEFDELLGRGGMGAVFKARQPQLDRAVAVKILPRASAADPEFAERFRREARALASLDHPNIVTLHDFGEREGLFYFVMEFVDGVDLAQRIAARSLTTDEALQVVTQICGALQYSHDRGVVHRDIKPANILLDREGSVKIADFGLAKLVNPGGADFGLTRTNAAMGTPRYMAPEQMESAATADHRVDIYSVGVVFYELLTGEVPSGHFPPPSRRVPSLSDHFDDVVLRALDADAGKRYQSAAEVATSLSEAIALRLRAPGGKRELTRRFLLYRALPLAVFAGGAASAGVWFLLSREERRPTPETPSEATSVLRRQRERLPAGRLAGETIPSEVATRQDLVQASLGGGAGREFGLALSRTGDVLAWGDNRYGQREVPEKVRDAVAVAAACGAKGAHCLALLASGEVIGWGDDSYGQARLEAGPSEAVAAGELHSMVLTRDGRVAVFGHGAGGLTEPPAMPRVEAIASGAGFCLALAAGGQVFAWGLNRAGQCEIPRWVRETAVTAIAAGDAHALALTHDGKVFAWGEDTDGPTNVPDNLGEVSAIFAGASASAALTSDGLRAWGRFHGNIPLNAHAVAFARSTTAWLTA